MCINTLLLSPDASLFIERQREQGVSWWGGYHCVCLCLSPFVLTVREGVLWVCHFFCVSLSLSRDSEGVVWSVFSNRLSPLFSIHNSVSLCLTETQTDRLRDQQRRVWGQYED